MMDVIVIIVVVYLVYRLVFDFIVPVSKTVSHIKQNAEQMHRRQEEYRQKQEQKPPPQQSHDFTKKNSSTTDGEYIDFEEVKE